MILASQSPRRQELLRDAGYEFATIPSAFDEAALTCSDPAELVHQLARGKAGHVAPRAGSGEPVIGSDTVVVLDGTVLGKPLDVSDAERMLRMLSGRTHQVHTGVSVIVDGSEVIGFTETADVTFWDLDEEEIDDYVASGEPMDKAGAYGIQGLGRTLVKGINGDFYAIMGLPISRLVRELRAKGLR